MKTILIISALTFLCVVSYTSAGNPMIKAYARTCQKQENASEADVDKLADGIVPETPEGKCLSACLGKQFNILVDNKLSKDGFLEKVSMKFVNDQPSMDKAGDAAAACLDTFNEDRCESAYEIWKCITKEAEKRELKFF